MPTNTLDPLDAATAALGRALAGLADLGAVPSWQLSDDALAGAVRRLDAVTRLAQAQLVRVAAEAGSRGLPAQRGHRRLEHWVRELVPTSSPRVAAAQARRAERLFSNATAAELGPTREALLAGKINVEQADVVALTVEALLPPNVPVEAVSDDAVVAAQGFLLEQAGSFDPSQLHRLAKHLQHRLDPGADERLASSEEAQQCQRSLTLAGTLGGMVHVEGLLTPGCGAALRTAIDAWSAPQPAADGTPDPRTAAQRRHDGLQVLAEKVVASGDLLPSTHGSAYRVVVTVPFETLAATLQGRPVAGLTPATLPDGAALSSCSLATLTCGADLLPILVDGAGNPLDVGLTQRLFPTKQRAAIAHRDQTCTYPGCSAPPAWCDAHHLIQFSENGSTAVTNGALLCGHHHRHVHAAGAVGRLVDGEVVWATGPPGDPPQPALTGAIRLLDSLVRRWRTP